MKKLYEKSEITFAIILIVIYCVAQTLAISLNKLIGVDSSAAMIINIVFAIILFVWLKRNNLFEKYGLCKTSVPAKRFLWYIPLLVIMSHNFWHGVSVNLPLLDIICYICSMICVGFLEEVIFRGFLFKAISKDSKKQAIVISSITFGLGHLLNLINGSGADLLSNICQVVGAIAIGFLFVTIFYRGGSLIPCIIAHSFINAISVFVNEAALTPDIRIVSVLINTAIVIAYALVLTKTLPKINDKNDVLMNN